MNHIVPEIIDEQRVAELLAHAGDIIEPRQSDPAAAIHIHGYEMAMQTHDLLQEVFMGLCTRALGNTAKAARVVRTRDYQSQLAAHHLDMLDRTPA